MTFGTTLVIQLEEKMILLLLKVFKVKVSNRMFSRYTTYVKI